MIELLGTSGKSKEWFNSYLMEQYKLVELQHTIKGVKTNLQSNKLPVTCGLPQGSVLSPILFILFYYYYLFYSQMTSTNSFTTTAKPLCMQTTLLCY